MSPAELPTGAPRASPSNHIGERVLEALESYEELGNDLRRDIAEIKTEVVKLGEGQEKLRTEVTEIKTANGEIKSSIAYIKDSSDRSNSDIKSSIERNNIKIDQLAEKTDARMLQIDDRASDMKSNITSLGAKANANILLQSGGILVIVIGFITLVYNFNTLTRTLNNTNTDSQFSSPSFKVPPRSP